MDCGRMALIAEQEKEIAHIEAANFVLLSLYREYSLLSLRKPLLKESCMRKMRQIKHDLRYLPQKELLIKVEKLYKPLLRKIGG